MMTEDFKRIYRELQEAGGIESAKDLTEFVETIDGLLAAFKELKERREGWVSIESKDPPESDNAGDTVSKFVNIRGIAKYHYPTKNWCWIDAEWKPLHTAVTAARGK